MKKKLNKSAGFCEVYVEKKNRGEKLVSESLYNRQHVIFCDCYEGGIGAGDEPAADAGARVRAQPGAPPLHLLALHHEPILSGNLAPS